MKIGNVVIVIMQNLDVVKTKNHVTLLNRARDLLFSLKPDGGFKVPIWIHSKSKSLLKIVFEYPKAFLELLRM